MKNHGWRRSSYGLYVPAAVDGGVVEQRILEQGSRVRGGGAVTAWASLRWRGAAYFDGTGPSGEQLAVPLVVGRDKIREGPGITVCQEQIAPSERELVDGLWVTTVQRALFDEVRRLGALRPGVAAVDMTAAAELISVWLFASYVWHRHAWTGVPLVREVLPWAIDESRSPMETLLRLCWEIDAGLPRPLCNVPVFDAMDGRLLGVPDLFDPVAGVVGEYDGAHHKDADQHRADVVREGGFRDHGLEYFAVVEGQLRQRRAVAERARRTRERAKFLPPESCAWTLTPPPWWTPTPTLDERLERAGMVERLTHR
ncbi:hypothetical protein D9V37_00305 [Nocardioides mangrovicus]|uniref:Uncharacterized protein n=1 Tax=Nocardioides mangrovicus TaxID=2478913 RepID=A0A3L8P5Y1_9ACTN|nr:hypothetical protein [Nocardioides mangrovicus]RLV50474.1 hypothetical protein D9V37_00305 [Nocardioides mangrovicus]